ncbi:hypothetical protein FKW77_004249 [Venturia effusa]|uniref:Uncharacterized protein n=1 Tax=Venturia effusa TaxID=50376 RepID=A0A517L157_9PEZI|nr:hypothetical protein FKW77_004249 [Venturia effusa]
MSILASSVRASIRKVATTSSRSFSTSQRTLNYSRDSSAPSSIANTFRNVAERAQAEASDESFKAGVVYTLLGVSAFGAGVLTLSHNEGKTVGQHDLL